MMVTGSCEACGEWSDNLVVLPSAPDWADDDLWCQDCADQPTPDSAA